MFCHKCGTQIAKDAAFCQNCGTKVVYTNDVQQSSDSDAPIVEPQQTGAVEPTIAQDTPSPDDAKAKKDAILHKIENIGRVLMIGPVILMVLSSFGILPFPVILLIIGFPLGTILSIIGAKRPWGLKKTIEFIVAVLVSLVLILARSSLLGGTGDKYVQMVKNGTLEAYPQMEVGKAFDSYLKNPKWESGLSEDNTRFVNVTGKILYYDKEVEIVVQFIVNEKDETFQYNACKINDVPQNNLVFWCLLENIYNSDSTSSGLDSPSDYDLSSVSNPSSETNTSVSDNDASVRSAYIQKVQELVAESSDFKFNLIDLTPNDVYELVADMPGYYVNVYVYDNGSVIPIMEEWGYGAGGNQGYQYLPGKNIILNSTLGGAGREVYETYMCVDSNNKVVNVYDHDLCFSYPSSYYYGSTEIDEYTYSCYQVHGAYNEISGNSSADDIIAALNSGTDIRSSVSGEILINGRTAASLLGVPINSVIKQWGEPLDFNDENNALNYCAYDGITLYSHDYGITEEVRIPPEMCMIDGNTLDKYRDGIDEILGTAERDGWDEWYDNLYSISYTDYSDDYNIYVYMESPDDKPNFISISSF